MLKQNKYGIKIRREWGAHPICLLYLNTHPSREPLAGCVAKDFPEAVISVRLAAQKSYATFHKAPNWAAVEKKFLLSNASGLYMVL